MKNLFISFRIFLSRNLISFLIIGVSLLLFDNGICQESKLKLNDLEYFETQGVNVFVFSNQYNGMFFDEKTAGIEIIHHGVRTCYRRCSKIAKYT